MGVESSGGMATVFQMRGHLFTRDAAVTTCSTTIVSITLPPFQQFLTSVIITITSILQRSFKFTNHLTVMKSCVTKWYIFHTRVIISFSSFYLFCLFIFQFYLSNASIILYCCYIGFWSVINTSRFRISWKQSRHVQQWQKRDWGTARGSVQLESFRGELKLASSSVFDLFQDGGDVTRVAAA